MKKGDATVGLEIEFTIRPDKRTEFLIALDWIRDSNAGEPGAGIFVYERIGAPNHFLWVARWPSRAALSSHCGNARHKAMLGAMDVLGQVLSVNTVAYTGEG
jgi:quinol monooxygenase YgiN